MRLIELGSKRLAIAFALGLAGAIAACGGDDNNGNPGGGGSGGTGGTSSMMDAKGGGGTSDAAPDSSEETGPGGSGGTGGTVGTGGSDATGMGGSGTGDAGPDVIVVPDGPPPTSDASDASATPDVSSDGGTPTADSSDAAVTPPTDDAPPEVAPPNEAAPGTSVIFAFDFNAGSNFGWRAETNGAPNGAVAGIAEGAPGSTGGSIEWSGTIDPDGTVVFFQYGEDNGTGATRTDLADVHTLQLDVRLHNPVGASTDGLASITLQFVGGANSNFATSSGDFIDFGAGQEWTDFLGGAWTHLTVMVGDRTGDGGPNNADLWRIAVQLNGTMDAGATPLVLDVDNVTVTR